jgi:hypothetical protein
MLFESLKAGWILTVFVFLFFWFPGQLFSRRVNRGTSLGIAGNWARMVLFAVIAIFVLSKLRVLTALAIGFILLIAFAWEYLHRIDWKFGALNNKLQRAVVQFVRNLETSSFHLNFLRFGSAASDPLEQQRRSNRWSGLLKERGIPIVCVLVAVTIAVILRYANAWDELRFNRVEQYDYLLRARELILNVHITGRPFVFPPLIATTSLVSAVDPIYVTRFLSALIGVLLVLAIGAFLQATMRVSLASAAAMYCLGSAAFPPAAEPTLVPTSLVQKIFELFAVSSPATTQGSSEFELGLVFVLLGLAFVAEWHWTPHKDSLLDIACCVFLAGLISPFLLVLFAIAAVTLLFQPKFAPVAFLLFSFEAAIYARLSSGSSITNDVFMTLPVAAAIAAGWFLAVIITMVRSDLGRRTEPLLLAGCLLIAAIWLRPHKLVSQPLEYDSAARQTQEITGKFAAQKWVVVAPVEQFPETLGFGGYEDLADFVAKNRSKVASRDFHFASTAQDLFIYVESKPFQVFDREPLTVPFAVLTDATYRSYRSPAGRASLESDALQLCESYRQAHSDMEIYFRDENLRIYRVHRDEVLKAAAQEGRAE